MNELSFQSTGQYDDMPTDAVFFGLVQQRFDGLLHREILRLRMRYQLSLDEFRGLYISDDQVDALLRQAREQSLKASADPFAGADGSRPEPIADIATLSKESEQLAPEIRAAMPRRWRALQQRCGLDELELELIQLALLMELDNKYETLFGYLNNDVSRKFPTVDMALRLLDAPRERLLALLLPQGRLFSHHLLTFVYAQGAGATGAMLSSGFRLDAVVAAYLLGLPYRDVELDGLVRECSDTGNPVSPMATASPADAPDPEPRAYEGRRERPITVLEGRPGTGRFRLAVSACAGLGVACFTLRLDRLPNDLATVGAVFQRLQLQLCLSGGGIAFVLDGLDSAAPSLLELRRLFGSEAWQGIPLFLLVTPGSDWQGLPGERLYLHRAVSEPDVSARQALWRQACARNRLQPAEDLLAEIGGQFLLTPRQIEQAVGSLALLAPERDIDRDLLYRVARQHSVHDLDKLAQKVVNRYSWDDVVLPPYTERGVREFVAAIRNRHRVYSEWNMGWRSANAHGLIAMFSGSSGTGKTVTASVIANAIGLELYRVDLSAVVSKYIGETEKNLDRIFDAAQRANVILFLDECDSLMGKRSEVKDAHDRYANLEVSYLLQRMELHQGVVVAATNFAKNMDQAFARRMHYVIEFARPNEAERERLWRSMFPRDAPLADDVNFGFLAGQFELPGGDIRTIALDAAFLAAEDGQVINMQHLVNATARQLIKQGKAPRATEFKQYQGLLV